MHYIPLNWSQTSDRTKSTTIIYFFHGSYKAYKARKYIAVIDWNCHLDLPSATSKSGNEITSRRYNQRSQQWDVRTVKQNKTFDYIPMLIANMLRARLEDNDLLARNVSLNESDPRLVAPTIAAKPPPSLEGTVGKKKQVYCALQTCQIIIWSGLRGDVVKWIIFPQYFFHIICKQTMYIHLESHCAIMLSNKKNMENVPFWFLIITQGNTIWTLDFLRISVFTGYIFIEGESLSRENSCGTLKWKSMDHCIFYCTEMHMHDTCTRVKKNWWEKVKFLHLVKYIPVGGVSEKFRVHQLSNKIVHYIKRELLYFVRSTCGRVLPWTL